MTLFYTDNGHGSFVKESNAAYDSGVITETSVSVKFYKAVKYRVYVILCRRTSGFSCAFYLFVSVHSTSHLSVHLQKRRDIFSMLTAFNYRIKESVLELEFCTLECVGKLFARDLLDNTFTGKSDKCPRL